MENWRTLKRDKEKNTFDKRRRIDEMMRMNKCREKIRSNRT